MPKKRRSIKVLFASTVLSLEAFVVFFSALVAFGIGARGLPPAVLLTGGIVFSAVLVVACAFLTRRFGYAVGWALQVLLIATGFVVPMMFLIGALFTLTWWYGTKTGARLDRENVQRDADQAEWERRNPEANEAGPAAGPE